MRYIHLDLETTGLSPERGDRIIEVGAVEAVDKHLTGREFHAYFNPGRTIHPDALAVHGLTNVFLADKPDFKRLVGPLSCFLDRAHLFIHNAAFDLAFLDAEFERAGHPPLRGIVASVHDTLPMFKAIWPGERCNLETVCHRLSVDVPEESRGALRDAKCLAVACLRVQTTVGDVWSTPLGDHTAQFSDAIRWIDSVSNWPDEFGVALLQRKFKLGYREAVAWMNQLIRLQYARLAVVEGTLGYAKGERVGSSAVDKRGAPGQDRHAMLPPTAGVGLLHNESHRGEL